MKRALELAESASYITSPNPRVGCVLVNKLGSVIGEGHTQKAGAPHAEVMALAQAAQNGADTKGATVYVTLEPCAHTGRTPPCTTSLIHAGVSKVVASHIDPNPKVSGLGFEKLRAAGIQVQIGLGSETALALNEGFVKRMTQSLPLVRLKIASSIDGGTALQNGASQWITAEGARKHAHAWRAKSCALITGIGTVLSDDPSLNVRFVSTPRQPKLVIVDANLDTPTQARLFEEKREVIIYCASADEAKHIRLTQRGALVVEMPDPLKPHHVDLKAMLADLATKEINEIHIEAGQGLNTNFIKLDLVDEFLIYLAPLILGDAKGWTKLPALENLSMGKLLSFLESLHLGQDIFIRARPTQATQTLSVPHEVFAQ